MAALEALAGFSNLQEVILQNFVPHRRYYGEEPAEIATDAAEHYWRTGLHDGPSEAVTSAQREAGRRPGVVLAGDRGRHGAARARGAAADARGRRPDPAQPGRLVAAARGRGGDRSRRAERQRRPHLARAPVPVAVEGAQAAGRGRLRAHGAALRLPAVHRPGVDGAGRARRRSRRASGASSRAAAPAGSTARRARCGRIRSRAPGTAGRSTPASSPRCSPRRGPRSSRTCARPRTSCAPSWRATRSRSS